MVGTGTALLAAGAMGGGANIFSSIFGNRAANKAAQTQAAGAKEAQAHIDGTISEVNPILEESANNEGQNIEAAGDAAAVGVNNAAQAAGAGVRGASANANTHLRPYMDAGTDAVTKLSDLVDGPDFETKEFNFEADPGYQFALDEGLKAAQKSAAARGTLKGGGTMKELTRYGTGVAQQGYQQSWERHQDEQNSAFDRFFKQKTARGSGLEFLAGMGRGAASEAGQNEIGAEQYAGNMGYQGERDAGGFRTDAAKVAGGLRYDSAVQRGNNRVRGALTAADLITGGAAAKAGGIVGGANAVTSGVNGIANNVGRGLVYGSMLRPGGGDKPWTYDIGWDGQAIQ
jgi:hypothetical protein